MLSAVAKSEYMATSMYETRGCKTEYQMVEHYPCASMKLLYISFACQSGEEGVFDVKKRRDSIHKAR